MIRAGAGLSTRADPVAAAREAAEAALVNVGRPDSALLWATPDYAAGIPALLEAAAATLGTEMLVGATAHGVLAGGRDCESGPAVSVLAQSGLEAQPFFLPDLAKECESAGEEIASRLGGSPRPEDLVVLFPDPRSLDVRSLLAGVGESLAPARIVGAGAADPVSALPLQWCGTRAESGGLAGMVLRAPRPVRVGVTQACRPVSELLTVTRFQGNWLLELDGRPALDVYREVARGPLAEDLRRAAAFLLIALPRDPGAPLSPGGYLVRHAVGFDPAQKAFALPEPVERGQQIAFALREPQSARDDMKAMLAGLGVTQPAFGLYLNCCARGASFFGVPGLEAAYLENRFGSVPIAGMFGSCEIGPVGGVTELLTYTGVRILVDDADPKG